MKVLLEFKGSHHYFQEYNETQLYCPLCGKQEVWEEDGPGDYYAGPDFVCVNCNSSHSLIHSGDVEESARLSVINQLRTGECLTPTTRKGR